MNENNHHQRQISHLEERIDMLVRELQGKRRSTNWTSNLTLLVGFLVIILLCIYFGFGYYTLNDISRPDRVVQSARGLLDDYAKEARTSAATEIRNSAPVWAREISNELVVNMPRFRERAETALDSVLDEQVRAGRRITTEQFSKLIRDHRTEFKQAIDDLSTEGDANEFVNQIMPIVEREYVPALRFDAIQILGVLDDLNHRLDRLASADDLNPVEEKERHILGLARLLREQRAPETFDRGELEAASN